MSENEKMDEKLTAAEPGTAAMMPPAAVPSRLPATLPARVPLNEGLNVYENLPEFL
jgi:hypothetical protein